ncbi:hypothetical protein ABZP36_004126 [Zizania latifolia]
MAGWVNLVNEWLVRALILSSLAAHLVVAVLAAVRRREASGWPRGILWLANQAADLAATQTLGNLFLGSTIQSSGKKLKWACLSVDHLVESGDDEQALLAAHQLLHITKGAFADYSSVEHKSSRSNDDRSRWRHGWEPLCRLVETELSLMYDVLYTKAAVIHTWHGYCIRFASLHFTAIAFWLFSLSSKDGYRWSDVYITYLLLIATFVLELRWLLRALASTWTYAFLRSTNSGLHHAALCSGRWRRLRRFVVSLDVRRLSLARVRDPRSYRMWSGKIGQYNLLYECTHDVTSLYRTLAQRFGSEDSWKEYKYHYSGALRISSHVRVKLFKTIWDKLTAAYDGKPEEEKHVEKPEEEKHDRVPKSLPTSVRRDSVARRRKKLDKTLDFAPELQDNILTYHLATDIFLQCSGQKGSACEFVKTIEALSNYMLFLAVVRPYMLPGLNIHSSYTATHDALHDVWCAEKKKGCSASRSSSTTKEGTLASILNELDATALYNRSVILHEGAQQAKKFLEMAAENMLAYFSLPKMRAIGETDDRVM